MRVTSLVPDAQYQMQQAAQALATADQQVSTGLRVNQLSDDPAASANMVASLAASANVDQYTTNVSSLTSQLQTADSAMSSIVSALNTAITTGTSAANGTTSAANQQAAAAQIEGLLGGIITQGNTSFEGVYIFGGSETSNPPFVAASTTYTSSTGTTAAPLSMATPLTAGDTTTISDATTGQSLVFTASAGDTVATLAAAVSGAVAAGTLSAGTTLTINGSGQLQIGTNNASAGIVVNSNDPALGTMSAVSGTSVPNSYAYVGNGATNNVAIGQGQLVASNVPGSQLLTTGTNVIGSLNQLISAITSSNSTQIQTAVNAVTSALNAFSSVREPMDNTISQLNSQESFLSQEKVTLSSQQSSLVGISLSTAATNLSQAETNNEAVLAAAAKAIPESLLNYLQQ